MLQRFRELQELRLTPYAPTTFVPCCLKGLQMPQTISYVKEANPEDGAAAVSEGSYSDPDIDLVSNCEVREDWYLYAYHRK